MNLRTTSLICISIATVVVIVAPVALRDRARSSAAREYEELHVATERVIDLNQEPHAGATEGFCGDFVSAAQANDPLNPPCKRIVILSEASTDDPTLPQLDAVLEPFPDGATFARLPASARDAWTRKRIEAALVVALGPTTVFVRDGKVIAAANRTKDRERRGWNMDVRLKATRAYLKWSVSEEEPADPHDVLAAFLRARGEEKR